jgi:uncharacterized membrane protein YkoI
MMKSVIGKSLVIGLLTLVLACTNDNETSFQPYSADQLGNLTLDIVNGIETPYASVIKANGGRVKTEAITLAEIAQKLADIFPDAIVLGAESETERGLEVWSIKLKMPYGGILKIKFVKELGKIIKMKGKPGPYDYEVDPGGSFIKFSEAKASALGVIDGEIKSWKLQIEEENAWEYEFHIVQGNKRFEVEIKGFDIEVLSVKEKHDGDDEDNDGDDQGDDDDDHNVNMDAPTAVVAFVNSLFEGTVTHSELRDREHEDDGNGSNDQESVWKVYVESAEGAVVMFKIAEDPLALLKMGGEIGPFTYEIDPGNDLISFAEALDKVNSEVDGDLMEWELESEAHQGEVVWTYEFEVHGANVNYEIEIDALTGQITKFEEQG